MKTEQLKSSRITERKKIREKWMKPKGLVRNHQVHQEMGVRKVFKNYWKKYWLKNSWSWWKIWIYKSKRLKKLQVGQNQRDQHKDTYNWTWKVTYTGRIFKSSRLKWLILYRGASKKIMGHFFPSEALEARRQGND